MPEGIFQKVTIQEGLKVNKDVEGFVFYISRLEGTDKVFLEVVVPRGDGKELRIDTECLLPGWVFSRIKMEIDFRDAISFACCGEDDFIEFILTQAAQKLEDLLRLEIGIDRDRIYFTIRFKRQEISIWDRVLSSKSVEDYIEVDDGII